MFSVNDQNLDWTSVLTPRALSFRQAQIEVANAFSNVATWETSDISRSDCVHLADFRLTVQRAADTVVELRNAR